MCLYNIVSRDPLCLYKPQTTHCIYISLRRPTVDEDEVDAGAGHLLPAEQLDVLHAQVVGQADQRRLVHVRRDVGHQGQVLHQAARLERKVRSGQVRSGQRV